MYLLFLLIYLLTIFSQLLVTAQKYLTTAIKYLYNCKLNCSQFNTRYQIYFLILKQFFTEVNHNIFAIISYYSQTKNMHC